MHSRLCVREASAARAFLAKRHRRFTGQLQFAWEKTVADASLNADPVFMRCV